ERACLPIASPKTWTMRSEKPLITFGWSPKSSAELTMPSTFTTRFTLSRPPSCVRVVASSASPTVRATWYASSTVGSRPTLRQATHGGGGLAGPATDEATRACLGPPTVHAGLADPATDEATRACLGPPTVHAGLADPVTEVLLIRRHRAAKFAAGDFVFPGGTLEADD